MAKYSLLFFTLLFFILPGVQSQNSTEVPQNAGQVQDSTNYQKEAIKTASKNGDWASLITIYFDRAEVFFKNSEFDKALDLYLKVDSISQKQKIFNPKTVKSIIHRAEIARTTFTRESSDYAYLLLQEALSQAKSIGSEDSIYLTYLYLADAVGLKGEYERAKEYIDLALEYFLAQDKAEFEKYVVRLYMYSTSYYKVKKRLDKVEQSFLEGIAYTRAKENAPELARLLRYYGNFQGSYLNSCEKALVSMNEAKRIYDSLNITNTADYERLVRDIADCHYDFKNHQLASEHYRIAYDLKSDLVKKANRELSRRVETKYQTEKKEQEIALLTTQNELADQKNKNQRNLFLAGGSVLSLAFIGLFFLYRNRQRTAKKLKELDSLKSRFFANISHEFRTPLTLINAPLEKKLSNPDLESGERTELETMERNSRRLLNLVDQLLDLSKLEAGKYQLRVQKGNLGSLIKAAAASFQYAAAQKNLSYTRNIDILSDVWFDSDVIEKIMANLLSNAMKYTPEGGQVLLEAKESKNTVAIRVTNSVKKEQLQALGNVFDRFYQANTGDDGAGIGLSLVKELVELSMGTITMRQMPDNKLKFEIVLPTNKAAYPASVQAGDPAQDEFNKPIASIIDSNESELDSETMDGDQEIMLVVEDHAEIRQLLKNTFADRYQIITAKNGDKGIKQALEWVPDIIISDIMMPGTDGLQLCQRLKTDERTSHIPIILLTAKAGEEAQYEGLTAGADAYVTKPFKIKNLETRVSKLIESRLKLRKRYSQEVILKPKDIAISNLDEQFLERVQGVLDERLTDSGLSVQEFSKAAGMSRMQLHRKLKALTGLSASEFLRSQRLKLAASLLQKSDANVSQIGYEVGFNDPSYFSKCFREAYGVSPTEYSKKSSS